MKTAPKILLVFSLEAIGFAGCQSTPRAIVVSSPTSSTSTESPTGVLPTSTGAGTLPGVATPAYTAPTTAASGAADATTNGTTALPTTVPTTSGAPNAATSTAAGLTDQQALALTQQDCANATCHNHSADFPNGTVAEAKQVIESNTNMLENISVSDAVLLATWLVSGATTSVSTGTTTSQTVSSGGL